MGSGSWCKQDARVKANWLCLCPSKQERTLWSPGHKTSQPPEVVRAEDIPYSHMGRKSNFKGNHHSRESIKMLPGNVMGNHQFKRNIKMRTSFIHVGGRACGVKSKRALRVLPAIPRLLHVIPFSPHNRDMTVHIAIPILKMKKPRFNELTDLYSKP